MIEQTQQVSAKRLVESLVILEQEAKEIGWSDVGGLLEVALSMAVTRALEHGAETPTLDGITEAHRTTQNAAKLH